MSFDSLTNRGEYLSAHYLAEVLPKTLKDGLFKKWSEDEKAGRRTPRARLRGLRRDYFNAKTELADLDLFDPERLRKLHDEILRALGFDPQRRLLTVEKAGVDHEVHLAHAEQTTAHGIIAIDCGWAVDTDAAQDPAEAGRLLTPVTLADGQVVEAGAKLASWLFGTENPPRYVLILNGGVVTLADRMVWGEGRYLAVSLDLAYGRNDEKELDVVAALFGADSLRPPAEGGTEPLANLVAGSRQHAVGVSSELREGLRVSVELIANEVLDRIRQAGYQPAQVMDLDELAKELGREALRYLYRILFLLYAEARPELGVLPTNDPEYVEGYSLARLGDLVSRKLAPSAEGGFHLYESLNLLFRMVNEGHRPRGGRQVGEKDSEDVGLRFEPMRSDLFLPEKTNLIGWQIPQPGSDPDDPDGPKLDTRLRNKTLYQVLRRLMLSKGTRKGRGGFISYAQLGINQLGAVYEGLMSYTGFVATEHLYEVAKGGDPKDGSWMIPASKVDEYDDSVFVQKENPYTGVRSRVSYQPGQFVYRLAGRDRQTSASYYTPQSLTEVTVQLALKYRLDQDGTVTPARELLDWTICEPALGSGAFLNEAINQVAAEYLRRRQDELKIDLDPEDYHLELQKVKAYIALHNCYGVDLNRTAVELAEVSLWLNVMHAGLQAPWFGLHLQRGNSLIGGGRRLYKPEQLADKSWLTTAPEDKPFRDGPIDEGTIHHFLLPADGWGAVAGEKEARELAPDETERLKNWRTAMKRVPTAKGTRTKPSQVARLQGLARRVEFLWDLVQQRLAISEREIRRDIQVWGADDLPPVTEAVPREKILADLTTPGTPYWRLKTLMDVWCALWFWPLDKVGLLDGSDPIYPAAPVEVTHVKDLPVYEEPTVYESPDIFGHVRPQQTKLPAKMTGGTRRMTVAEHLRQQVPLSNLDDWLTFAEALVGRIDADENTERFYGRTLTNLSEMSEFEKKLDGVIGVDSPWTLADRFPWLLAAHQIADQQGFFHWELTFAQAFMAGGFDIQVGNPPWVRPNWNEELILAEDDPWFALVEKPLRDRAASRKTDLLARLQSWRRVVEERSSISGAMKFLTLESMYPHLAGLQLNLYRNFIVQTWLHACRGGIAGLVHPDSHFGGINEGRYRAAIYRRLRFHAHFVNQVHLFKEIKETRQFSINIYGDRQHGVGFSHISWLFAPSTLIESLAHDGSGPLPSLKTDGQWELRAHAKRVLFVNSTTLAAWRQLFGVEEGALLAAPLAYPLTADEQGAMDALVSVRNRFGDRTFNVTPGIQEITGQRAGLIVWSSNIPRSLQGTVLQGPHIGIGTPFVKQPKEICKSTNDWLNLSLTEVADDFIPRTNYRLVAGPSIRGVDADLLDESRGRYRIAWRKMIPFDTERSLFCCLIPPGPIHTDGVYSMVMDRDVETLLNAGMLASLPLDYLVRVSGKANLHSSDIRRLPVAYLDHPLARPLALRALRLNCVTKAYAPLWESVLCEYSFESESWAVEWDGLESFCGVEKEWTRAAAFRSARARRSACVEIDALASVWLGLSIDHLLAIYRSRFHILAERDSQMYFDATGRVIAKSVHAFGHGQTKFDYEQLMAYLDDPERNPVPEGYTAPFYKADRENEYRQAHAVFSKRLQDAIDAGWQPS